MIKKVGVGVLVLIFVLAAYVVINNRSTGLVDTSLQSGNQEIAITKIPTPTPYPIDLNGELSEQVDKMEINIFSEDFDNLKEDVIN